ncbi:uncharacterized protein G6M90_00g113330 [Metarhizium brunneum]|uniref:Uncharacterized protein n=1 Tax=Metarhizium brunneum TaxID=500148 RepID=A0A7D5ZAJ6_9HYPO|nr:hypothetical protein G6M90_00g113330 [Metarhizium brunneum]
MKTGLIGPSLATLTVSMPFIYNDNGDWGGICGRITLIQDTECITERFRDKDNRKVNHVKCLSQFNECGEDCAFNKKKLHTDCKKAAIATYSDCSAQDENTSTTPERSPKASNSLPPSQDKDKKPVKKPPTSFNAGRQSFWVARTICFSIQKALRALARPPNLSLNIVTQPPDGLVYRFMNSQLYSTKFFFSVQKSPRRGYISA